MDTDGDGLLDDVDQDDDCDNISDVVETDHLGTDPLEKNTDNDGVFDGLDLSPAGTVSLSAQIREIHNVDELDCCWPDDARWGDPFIDQFKLFVDDLTPLKDIIPFAGLRGCDNCHPHDQELYEIGPDFPHDRKSGDLKDDIRFYEHRMDQTNFPQAGWKIVLKDHDGGVQWGDDLYDIQSGDGYTKIAWMSLWKLAHPGSATTWHDGTGGDNGDAANLTAAMDTSAPMCGIEVASNVDQGTILLTENDLTRDCNPPDDYEVPEAPDCPIGENGQCWEY